MTGSSKKSARSKFAKLEQKVSSTREAKRAKPDDLSGVISKTACSSSDTTSDSNSLPADSDGDSEVTLKEARVTGKEVGGAVASADAIKSSNKPHAALAQGQLTPRSQTTESQSPATGADGCGVTASDEKAAKAAAKGVRADALLRRLSAKLDKATSAKKRLALQEKMLRVLPYCSPPSQHQCQQKQQQHAPCIDPRPRGAVALPVGSQVAAAPNRLGEFTFKLRHTPKGAMSVGSGIDGPQMEARRRLRQERFGSDGAAAPGQSDTADAALVDSGGLGTSDALEKEYLRLTSLPRASDVRPPAVLRLALRLVKDKWLRRPDYAAASEQLKAIRQDLTVQHVRDSLTVDVYETHGRLALEADDLAEFRRCHGVLRQLYSDGLAGNPAEFEAYGLLYTQATAAARNTLSLELSRVPEHLLGHPCVRHAMEVCAAARSGNYAKFIALYEGAPRMSPYIMDRLLGQMRALALQSTVAAYKPLPVPLEHLAAQLGLETEEEAADFARQCGAVVDLEASCLDTRASALQALGHVARPQ